MSPARRPARRPISSPELNTLGEPLAQLRLLFGGAAPSVGGETRHLIQLGARILEYRLRRAPRRRLAITIDAQGLRAGAALGLPLSTVEAFIRQHGAWVLDKLAQQEHAPKPQRIEIADGIRLPVFEREAEIRVLPGHNRVRWIGETLLLEARPGSNLNALARRGLQQSAMTHFNARLQHFAPQLDLAPPPLALSNARTRWGSCSTQGGIRLNWRLVHLPPALGDYVVVHELAHLHEMNHSARFWRQVARAYPEWREARAELRARAATLPVV